MSELVDGEECSSQYGAIDFLKVTPVAKRQLVSHPTYHPSISRRRSSLEVYRTFFGEFHQSKGSWLIILLGFLTAVGLGSLVGVVPQILTQQYAEKVFGYGDSSKSINNNESVRQCNSFGAVRPGECELGANYAQSAASYCALVKNSVAFLTNSVAGSYADRHGRKGESSIC